ncbi:MAG: nucleotidyltransferase family protein [Bacteroides cellulosilyticus]
MRRTFLTLVRSGLWNTPVDPTPFSSMNSADWEEIYQLARTQALLAITFDGVLSLPAELRPPRPLYLQWAAKVVQIEQSNLRLNEELPEVFMPYREAGLHPILLKGQGIATHYINPLHRQCGDIDVYIGKEGQPIANNILLRHGAEAEGEASDKHASYSFHGVHIENHRIILRINNPAGNRYFQRLIQEWYPQHAETREIHEYPVSLPPVTFNALYIFMHAFVHFLNSGIGLRQVCDWTRLLATRHEDIDKLLLEKYFRKVELLRAAKSFRIYRRALSGFAGRQPALLRQRYGTGRRNLYWMISLLPETSVSMTHASSHVPKVIGPENGTLSAGQPNAA